MARPKVSAKKLQKFLQLLEDTGNVSLSAEGAGVSRREMYRKRKEDGDFERAWDEAHERGVDRLEDIARQRAAESSDTLLIFLLKSNRPNKYRDQHNHNVRHSGNVAVDAHHSSEPVSSTVAWIAETLGAAEEEPPPKPRTH